MVLIFESHPVQYKAPVYRALARLRPGSFEVVYATDSSLRGHPDAEFGQVIAWNTPLLEGYPSRVLHNERGTPLTTFRSLTGRGVGRLLSELRPEAVLLAPFLYAFDLRAYLACLRRRIPIWIKHETQDEAFARPAWKSALRGLLYRLAYLPVRHAFYIGELNREHLRRHGIAEEKLSFAPLGSPVLPPPGDEDRRRLRNELRARWDVAPETTVLLFSGKLIEKKNPGLILDALARLAPEERRRFHPVFLGSGPLEATLRARVAGHPATFTGFVNQADIAAYYLAADLLILPSRRSGETWGLAVNEALQAGCGAIVTDAVGCHRDFGAWARVRVIPEGDAAALAAELKTWNFPRDFDWCRELIQNYSIETAAAALAAQIDRSARP
jgi:glycosyltransferase involved in cell wall biosynthesis